MHGDRETERQRGRESASERDQDGPGESDAPAAFCCFAFEAFQGWGLGLKVGHLGLRV